MLSQLSPTAPHSFASQQACLDRIQTYNRDTRRKVSSDSDMMCQRRHDD